MKKIEILVSRIGQDEPGIEVAWRHDGLDFDAITEQLKTVESTRAIFFCGESCGWLEVEKMEGQWHGVQAGHAGDAIAVANFNDWEYTKVFAQNRLHTTNPFAKMFRSRGTTKLALVAC